MQKSINLVRFLLLVAMFTMITACSNSPGSKDLDSQLKPKLANAYWDVTSIRETDGKVDETTRAMMGVPNKVYTLSYEYEVKFKKGLPSLKEDLKKTQKEEMIQQQEKIRNARGGMEAFTAAMGGLFGSAMDTRAIELEQLGQKYGNFKVGDTKKLTGNATFEKTEKGWIAL